jgi:hypothetical protein
MRAAIDKIDPTLSQRLTARPARKPARNLNMPALSHTGATS